MAHETRPRTLDPYNLEPLESWLAGELGSQVEIRNAGLLSGGAIGENWRLDAKLDGAPHEWVLRTDAASRMAMSHDRADEFHCLKAGHEAGACVPEPVAVCRDAALIGAPFMIVSRIAGEAQGRILVRDPAIEKSGDALVEELGRNLALIHSVRPGTRGLDFLTLPEKSPARVHVEQMRANLDRVSEPRPVLEYVLCWLEKNAPACDRPVLCHGDFRTGNFLADGAKLTGILDWEFSHWGDPHLDLGWFCARCWRFGADQREAGGIGSRAAFYRGYNGQGDQPVDEAVIPYWEVMAAARWAVVALLQGERHATGAEPSIELLLTGLMAPEMEHEAMQGIMALEATI